LSNQQELQAAAEALREVGSRARVYLSMPVIDGVTPRALVDDPSAVVTQDPSGLERKDGIFRLDEVGLSTLDHVALYGDGVFEGILIRNNSIFLYREHMDRLDESTEKVGIELPIDRQTLTERLLATCRQVHFPEGGAGYIRLVVTRGLGDLGINPHKCVSPTIFAIVSTIRLYSAEAYRQGIVLGLSRRIRRPSPTILDPNIKSNNYLNNVLALREGTEGTPLVESMMLTMEGYVAEATVDNIFSVLKKPGWESDPSKVEVRTPAPQYCLVGLTRNTTIQLAKNRGYRVSVRDDLLPIDFVGPGKECFMTGTGAGVMPITKIEGVPVGEGTPGPVTAGLIEDLGAMMMDPANGLPLDTPVEELAGSLGI
jgi:branched-chain amino acid aminotransferase